ncbi:MAG TPA: sigma-70 family RNA polymerase sigma factor [Candidatus Paceibacterota bacterium]
MLIIDARLGAKNRPGGTSYSMDQDETKEYFLQIYDAYADDIFRFCYLKVSSRELAEDLSQEVFARFWQAVREGTVMRSERALLYTIARNLIIDWYRKKKESSLDALTDLGIEFSGDDAGDVMREAEMQEALRIVRSLDEPSREALLLRYVEGLSPKEIARLTGETANAVSVRLNRAIKKVRASMHTHDT